MTFTKALLITLPITLLTAGQPEDPLKTLGRFKGTAPLSVKVRLQRWEEVTHRGKAIITQGNLSLDVTQNADGLQTYLEKQYVELAAKESLNAGPESGSEMPIRSLLKDLDYGRIHHLLDQEEVIKGLITTATFTAERTETWEGQAVRILEYTFKPHLSPEESYRLNRSEGHLFLRTNAEGLPLESEIQVSFEGRTSRMFGRFLGTKRTETRYWVVKDHLAVSERKVEEFLSREDGSNVTKTRRVFSVVPNEWR